MNRKLMSLVLAIALAVSMTAFSAMAEGKPFEGVTITFWGGQAELNPGTLAVIEKAEEALGLHVETEINPGGSEGDNILKTRIASNDLPDMMVYNSGSKLYDLNPSRCFLDIKDWDLVSRVDDAFLSSVTIDGANWWQQVTNVTLPLVAPAQNSIIILSLIGGLRTFDLIWAMTGGGPGFATDVLASVIYKQYAAGFYGLSTAGNVVMLILISVIAFPLQHFLDKREEALR